jgi:hypothetical protein
MISSEEGKKLLNLARKAITSCFEGKKCVPEDDILKSCAAKCGCFVTLHKDGELRGCIGFPEPVLPLHQAIMDAARAAAFEDPRFPPLSRAELQGIALEISVLTPPRLLKVNKAEDYLNQIRIGTDGLIIRYIHGSGLLLPQVATEWMWDARQFLEHTCLKAGLDKNAWKDLENRLYVFQAQIFSDS